ncbi:OLC1v1028733C1 [Oldenlandia corymbosa var. corymbosa]|uniref:OLC1v1028733C1 n=1 Tax=Oldenlandia corymbosa var. corymbosa TaxID=529605 RepID=A0AAV1CF71_OLDCO|nr:OLC1v1028733C1 [Oldenlandia corymbosa var. corymbosa]
MKLSKQVKLATLRRTVPTRIRQVKVNPATAKLLDSCYSALKDIKNPTPEDDDLNCSLAYFDSEQSGEARRKKEKGNAMLAFICKEAVMVAVDHSVSGTDSIPSSKSVFHHRIVFNPHVIGWLTVDTRVTREFLRYLELNWAEGASVSEVFHGLVDIVTSEGMGVSAILIAGWDKTVIYNTSLWNSSGWSWNFPLMSIKEAAKLARIAIRAALAESDDVNGTDECGNSGVDISVYYVRPAGFGVVDEGTECKMQ